MVSMVRAILQPHVTPTDPLMTTWQNGGEGEDKRELTKEGELRDESRGGN